MSYQPVETATDPDYRSIVYVTGLMTTGQTFQASGVMIAPNVVLTAGHVVDQAIAATVRVTPARAGTAAPFGVQTALAIAALPGAPTDGLLTRDQSRNDLGLIALNEPVGEQTGWMSLTASYGGGMAQTAGYPASYGGAMEDETVGTVADNGTATLLYAVGSVQAGSSGSPLWIEQNGQEAVVGVVSTAAWATQLTQADLDFIAGFEQTWSPSVSASVTATLDQSAGLGGTIAAYQLPTPTDGNAVAGLTAREWMMLTNSGSSPRFVAGTETVTLIDGTLSVSADTSEALVVRLYEGLLGRAPDQAGLESMHQLLAAGHSANDVASTILASPEYQAMHPDMTGDQFVAALYSGMLGRMVSSGEATQWTGMLAKGVARATIAVQVAASMEAKTIWQSATAAIWIPDSHAALLDRMYQAGMNRDPDAAALANWAGMPDASAVEIARNITASAEFTMVHGAQSASGFVSELYDDAFGRAADPTGFQYWSSGLQNNSMSRSDVLLSFAQSAESSAYLTRNIG